MAEKSCLKVPVRQRDRPLGFHRADFPAAPGAPALERSRGLASAWVPSLTPRLRKEKAREGPPVPVPGVQSLLSPCCGVLRCRERRRCKGSDFLPFFKTFGT